MPEAGSPWVLRDGEVALETHFTGDWGENLTGLGTITGEESTLEEYLEEDLGIARRTWLNRSINKINIVETNKVATVESNGVPGIVGSTVSAAAMVWDERSATASAGAKPASAKRARMEVTLSVGSGTVKSGAAATGGGRPNKN